MKRYIFSVYDRAAACYGLPFFESAKGRAIRSFQDECNRGAEDNPLFKHSKDFDLFLIGEFDDVSGAVVSILPEAVALGGQMQLKLDA